MMAEFGLPANSPLAAYLGVKQANDEASARNIQNATSLASLLQNQQMMPLQLQQLRQKLQIGDIGLQRQQSILDQLKNIDNTPAASMPQPAPALGQPAMAPQAAPIPSPAPAGPITTSHIVGDPTQNLAMLAKLPEPDRTAAIQAYKNELSGTAGTMPQPTAGAPQIQPQTGAMTAQPETDPRINKLLQMGDMYAKAGDAANAKIYYDTAKTLRPTTGTRMATVMLNGVPTVGVYDNMGQFHATPGAAPTPNILPVNTGGSVNLIDKNNPTAPPVVSLPTTATPSAQLSANTAVRGQNMSDKRAREIAGLGGDQGDSEGQNKYMENMAQMISKGQIPPLSGFALRSPMGMRIMGRVAEINPDYSGKDFSVTQNAEKQFTVGKQGNAVRSFNVALAHLDTLSELSDALKNNDIQMVNKVANSVATQTGNPAPTNFQAAKKIVGDEIVKAIVGSGGGVADRQEAAKTVSDASSPAQLKGVIDTYKQLMRGQLGGLKQQYEQSTKKTDFEKFLSPAAKAGLKQAPPATDITGKLTYNPATGKIE